MINLKKIHIAVLYRYLILELKCKIWMVYFHLFWQNAQTSTLCWCRWFSCLLNQRNQRHLALFDHHHGTPREPEGQTWKTSCFGLLLSVRDTLRERQLSKCGVSSSVPSSCCSTGVLRFTNTHTHTHARTHTHRLQSHTACFQSIYLWDGHWNFYHSRRTVSSPVDYAPLQLREGGLGIAQAPVWRKLEPKSRRLALGKFALVCVWERDGVLPAAPAGQQVTQRWKGIADIPESFPIKISTLVVEPAWWHVFMSARWQPN